MNHNNNRFMTVGHIRLLLVLMGLSLGWIIFAKLIVPPIIESAYRGESWSFINRMIREQAVHSVHHSLQLWNRVAIAGLVSSLGFLLIVLVSSSPAFIRRIVGEATPGSLGAIRMWTCAILLLTTLWEDLGSIAWLPVEARHPRGMLGYLYTLPIGFERLLTSEMSLRALQLLTELLLFLGLVGWRTRIVLPLGAFCYFLLLGILIDYSFFWHQNLVPLYVMIVLSFTPCGDGWSVDRLWKIYQGRVVPDAGRTSPVYGWSRYACWTMIALPYVTNGLSKLQDGGLFWWNPINMRTILYLDTLNPREFNWALSLHLVHAPDILFSLLGLFALFNETFFGFVLFSRIARRIFPVTAIMMHIGIFLLQRILFLDLILLQLVFFDFTPIRKAIGGWLAIKRGRLHVQPAVESESAQATTTGDTAQGLGYPLAVSGIIVVALLCWFFRIEFYPFTSWHLYSDSDTSGKVQYRKVFAQHESGVSSRARLEDTIGALALDNRYAPYLEKCFRDQPGDVEICTKFLSAAAAAYNKKAQPGERVTQYEIQTWIWDFLSYPSDPNYGNLTDYFTFEINTGRVRREKKLEDHSVADATRVQYR
jgi:hypothetical protein